jgi:hypothetical protein
MLCLACCVLHRLYVNRVCRECESRIADITRQHEVYRHTNIAKYYDLTVLSAMSYTAILCTIDYVLGRLLRPECSDAACAHRRNARTAV